MLKMQPVHRPRLVDQLRNRSGLPIGRDAKVDDAFFRVCGSQRLVYGVPVTVRPVHVRIRFNDPRRYHTAERDRVIVDPLDHAVRQRNDKLHGVVLPLHTEAGAVRQRRTGFGEIDSKLCHVIQIPLIYPIISADPPSNSSIPNPSLPNALTANL